MKKPVPNKIELYFHCRKCLDELPDGTSPQGYSNIEAGWTKKGLQVWCKRHGMNIVSLDFRGQKVAAE